MATSFQTSRNTQATVTISASSTPVIYNVSVPLAATEVSQALSANTKKFTIKVRGNSNLQLAFVVTESGTKFITVPRSASYSEDALGFSGTLFFQCDQPSQTVEIVEWT